MDNYVFARPDWHKEAACRGMMQNSRDPRFFIPRGGDNALLAAKAKRVCEECGVVEECLDYAIRLNIEVGVWGATTGAERREIRKQRGIVGTEDTYWEDLREAARLSSIDSIRLEARKESSND